MSIELGSIWIDNDSDLLVIIKSLEGSCDGKVKVVFNYIVRAGSGCFEATSGLDLFLNTKTKLVQCNEKGNGLNQDDQNLNYRAGYNDGWHDCEASFELGNEFTDNIQEQAYDEGYDQAIDDLIEAGVIGEEEYLDEDYSDEDYSEYEFGAVEDDEEEYCFSKELDKILNGAFVMDNKSDGVERKHSHYFKDVRHLDYLDVYELNKLFPIDDDTDCILHARKKLLVCGGRGGSKDMITDITDARDTLNRYLQIEGIE